MIMGDTQKEGKVDLKIYIREREKSTGEGEFTYLGVKIKENGKEDQETKARIVQGNRKYEMLRILMRSKDVSIEL